jgi:hypothetical protein
MADGRWQMADGDGGDGRDSHLAFSQKSVLNSNNKD